MIFNCKTVIFSFLLRQRFGLPCLWQGSVSLHALVICHPLRVFCEYLVRPRLCVASPLLHLRPLFLVFLRLRAVKVVIDDTLHDVLAVVGADDGSNDRVTSPDIHRKFDFLVVVRPVGVLCHVHHDGALWLPVHPYQRNGCGL